MAAGSAFSLFQKIRIKKIKEKEQPFYDEAREKKLLIEGEEIHTFEFGNPTNDLVILIHGWDSNVGCLYKFVEPLLAKNKHVIGVSLPAHAFHKASKTNMYEAKEMFRRFLSTIPNDKKPTIISHSFGSGVVALALAELPFEVDQLVFLTSPNEMSDIFLYYQKLIGLHEKSYKILVDKASEVLGEELYELSVANKLTQANFDRLHLFHDESDKILPYKNSQQIFDKIDRSTLYTFNKIGHYRMLWNDELLDKVMEVV
jgi:pimeloyl-ACP methyl ester carboxylesterase